MYLSVLLVSFVLLTAALWERKARLMVNLKSWVHQAVGWGFNGSHCIRSTRSHSTDVMIYHQSVHLGIHYLLWSCHWFCLCSFNAWLYGWVNSLAVKAFEKILAQAGRLEKHYHEDNGVFAHNSFLEIINQKDKKIMFFAVGAHHQNWMIKKRTKC